jgi:CheY-like chemotaxis protein
MDFQSRHSIGHSIWTLGYEMDAFKPLASAGGRPIPLLLHRLKGMFAGHTVPELPWLATLPSPDAAPALVRPLVLVVDDNPVNLMLASEMLSYCGIKPLLANDGAEAVALACDLRLDLILMDLTMPVLDGFDATARIRRFEHEHARPRVPVVAYTATLDGADKPRLRECGIDAVLEKPTDVHAFQACVMRWCSPGGDCDALAPYGALHPPMG